MQTLSPLDTPRVLVLGAGAIGGFYGYLLSLAKAHVTLVCRSEYHLVKEHGYGIFSKSRGDATFIPHDVIFYSYDYQGKYPDFLLVTLKVTKSIDRVALMKDFVGSSTVIVLIENGIEIEKDIATAFPNNQIISCLAFVQVSRISPRVIEHYAYGELTLGNYPNGISKECEEFARLLQEASGITMTTTEDVVGARWRKTVWNASFNPLSVLGGVIDTTSILNTTGGENLVRGIMEEVRSTAKAAGHPIPDDWIDHYLEHTKNAPPYKTSMSLDWQRKQDLEIEAILDNTLAIARREQVSTPLLESITSLLKMLESQRALGQI